MKLKKLLLVGVTLIAMLVGFLSIAPSTMSFDEDDYSAKVALEHLQVIADEPHSVYHYDAHERVRQYLIETAKGYAGAENVTERNYLTPSNKNPNEGIEYVGSEIVSQNHVDAEFDIRNILVKLPGESDVGMLLVAHYDSRGNIKRYGELAKSYGAGDDGYGVVTLLEIMRYVTTHKVTLKNSLYFLFADAEEPTVGEDGRMLGSYLESRNTELMDKVNFVINVESRGMKGAVYMFETSKNNNKVMSLYKKAVDPVSYSIAPAVYSIMTNYTDFTNFLDAGKQGINFSTLNDIEVYHVPSDKYENANAATLEHYGRQILPMVIEYVSSSQYGDMHYFEGTRDLVFFNLLPGVFVTYGEVVSIIFAFVFLLAFVAILVVSIVIKKEEFSWKKFLISLAIIVAGIVISVAVGYLVSLVVARLGGYPWSLTNIRNKYSRWIMLGTFLALFALFYFVVKKLIKKENLKYLLTSATALQVLLYVVTSFALPGASFLFMLPAFFGIAYYAVKTFVKKGIFSKILTYVTLFALVLIFTPLIVSLEYALTIGGLLALALLSYFPVSVLLPMLQEQE